MTSDFQPQQGSKDINSGGRRREGYYDSLHPFIVIMKQQLDRPREDRWNTFPTVEAALTPLLNDWRTNAGRGEHRISPDAQQLQSVVIALAFFRHYCTYNAFPGRPRLQYGGRTEQQGEGHGRDGRGGGVVREAWRNGGKKSVLQVCEGVTYRGENNERRVFCGASMWSVQREEVEEQGTAGTLHLRCVDEHISLLCLGLTDEAACDVPEVLRGSGLVLTSQASVHRHRPPQRLHSRIHYLL